MFAVVTSWLLILMLQALAVPAPAPVRTVTLPNGLTILLASDSTAVAVDVGVWYRAGTRFEAPGKSGVAQMFGRLMFQGTRRHPAGECDGVQASPK